MSPFTSELLMSEENSKISRSNSLYKGSVLYLRYPLLNVAKLLFIDSGNDDSTSNNSSFTATSQKNPLPFYGQDELVHQLPISPHPKLPL